MAISLDDARHVAKLARLDLKPEELELYTKQLNDVLNYAQELQKLDTDNIKPTFNSIEAVKPLREDKVEKFENMKRIIENGPEVSGTSFVVPRIYSYMPLTPALPPHAGEGWPKAGKGALEAEEVICID